MATRGNDIKGKIQAYVDEADHTKSSAESNLHKVKRELESNMERRLVLMQTIADTQMEAMLNGENVRDLTGRLTQVLNQREADYQKLEQQMEEARARIKQAELEIATNGGMLNEKRDAAHKEMQGSPEIEALHQQQATLAEEIKRLSALLDDTQDECRSKLKAFDADPSFLHLINRRFGTDQYKGMGLTQLMDGWLAKRVDFQQSFHDYSILQQLPGMAEKRLEEKVQARNEIVDRAERLEREILQRYGVDEAVNRLSKAEARLKDRRRVIADLQNALNDIINGRDGKMQELKAQVGENLQRLSIPTLERLTKATKSDRDEKALEEYKALLERDERLKLQEQQLHIRLREASDTFRRAKQLRDNFVDKGYDSKNRTFRDSFDTNSFINGYIAGTLTQGDLDSQVRSCSTYSSPEESRPSASWSTSNSSSSSSSNWSTGDTFGSSSSSDSSSWSTSDNF